MAKNELAVIDNFELSTNTDIMEALIEELGEDAKIPYDRVKIPSGGTTAFEVPSDDPDNPDIEKEIEEYIKENPRKVKIKGIRTITPTLSKKNNSSFTVAFLYFVLNLSISLANIIIRIIFINSLGWKVPTPGIKNQHLELLIVGPNKRSPNNKIFPII